MASARKDGVFLKDGSSRKFRTLSFVRFGAWIVCSFGFLSKSIDTACSKLGKLNVCDESSSLAEKYYPAYFKAGKSTTPRFPVFSFGEELHRPFSRRIMPETVVKFLIESELNSGFSRPLYRSRVNLSLIC